MYAFVTGQTGSASLPTQRIGRAYTSSDFVPLGYVIDVVVFEYGDNFEPKDPLKREVEGGRNEDGYREQ